MPQTIREIKFRAWDKKEKRILDISRFSYETDGREFKLMQYTGLKDKNGKEIYEGDIVTVVTKDFDYPDVINNGEVRFEKGHWEVVNHEDNYYLYGQDEVEIIGNIYENPELLNQ